MGVCLVSYAVSDANIAEVLADPPLIWRVVESDDEGPYLRELSHGARSSVFAKLLGRSKPAPEVRRLDFSEHELRLVDLDKSWDGLNACLKLCVPQAPNFFEGSGQVGRIEVGYGPAHYHRSETMARIADAYAGVREEELLAALHSINPRDLYPKALWQRKDDQARGYLTENFAELLAFVQFTREHSLGAIIQFT